MILSFMLRKSGNLPLVIVLPFMCVQLIHASSSLSQLDFWLK